MVFILSAIATAYLLFLLHLRRGVMSEEVEGTPVGDSPLPAVSVIVAARDEAYRIDHLLDKLSRQGYPADMIEFIIVDDHSTDGTADIIAEKVEGDSRFRLLASAVVPVDVAPKKWALTQGINASTGAILLMTDADSAVSETWAAETSLRVLIKPFIRERKSEQRF